MLLLAFVRYNGSLHNVDVKDSVYARKVYVRGDHGYKYQPVAICNRGYFSAAFKGVLTNFWVNECLFTTTVILIVLASIYFPTVVIPIGVKVNFWISQLFALQCAVVMYVCMYVRKICHLN